MKNPRIPSLGKVFRRPSRRALIGITLVIVILIASVTSWFWFLPASGIIPKDLGMNTRMAVILTEQRGGVSTILSDPLAQPLIADFSAVLVSPDDPMTIQFLDLSRGSPGTWSWDFGDGTSSADRSPVHNFQNVSANVTVTLTVHRADGAQSKATKDGLLNAATGQKPVILNTNRIGTIEKGSSVSFRVNNSGDSILINDQTTPLQAGLLVKIRANSDSDGSIGIRDGQLLGLTLSDATLFINGAQAARGPVGGINLKNPSSLATDIQFLVRPISGDVRQFDTNGSSVQAGIHDANIRIRNLDLFPRNDLTIESTPAYFSGDSVEYTLLPDIIAGFDPSSQVSGEIPLNITFRDRSAGAPTAWHWDFGDGLASSEQNPDHTYNQPGSYTVRLTVGNGEISNTIQRDQLVTASIPRVDANFSAEPVTGPAPLQVRFTDLSSGSPSYRMWDFGDGCSTISSADENVVHTYSQKGVYSVWMGIGNIFGSSDLKRQNYIIVSDPFQSPNNTVTLQAGRGGYLEAGSIFQFTVAGSPGTITSESAAHDLPVGTKVRLVILSDQYGTIAITNGKLVTFNIGNVSLYINDQFINTGHIDSVYVPRLDNVETSLSYYMPPSSAWTHYTENGYDVLADLENHWIRISDIGMNPNGVLSLIATENSTTLDGAAYQTVHDWIVT